MKKSRKITSRSIKRKPKSVKKTLKSKRKQKYKIKYHFDGVIGDIFNTPEKSSSKIFMKQKGNWKIINFITESTEKFLLNIPITKGKISVFALNFDIDTKTVNIHLLQNSYEKITDAVDYAKDQYVKFSLNNVCDIPLKTKSENSFILIINSIYCEIHSLTNWDDKIENRKF